MTTEERISHVAHGFVKAGRTHRAYCDRLVGKIGLHRNQHKILMMLSCCREKPSQKDLAKQLEISTAAVAVIIKKLELNGYITKTSAQTDGRFNEIEITPKGRSVVEETKGAFSDCDRVLFSGISEEELAVFERCCAKMCENLKNAVKEEAE